MKPFSHKMPISSNGNKFSVHKTPYHPDIPTTSTEIHLKLNFLNCWPSISSLQISLPLTTNTYTPTCVPTKCEWKIILLCELKKKDEKYLKWTLWLSHAFVLLQWVSIWTENKHGEQKKGYEKYGMKWLN